MKVLDLDLEYVVFWVYGDEKNNVAIRECEFREFHMAVTYCVDRLNRLSPFRGTEFCKELGYGVIVDSSRSTEWIPVFSYGMDRWEYLQNLGDLVVLGYENR